MTAPDVKHGGCHDCRSKDEPVLTSYLSGGQSIAVCSACRSARIGGAQ